jgi:hypothetical protein
MPTRKPATIRIRYVAPGDPVPTRKRRPTYEEIGLHADMSQFYAMKAVLEEALGHPVYLKLKETGTMTDWRKATIRLLDAVALAIDSTVLVADQEWREDITAAIRDGQEAIKRSDTISQLFAALSSALTRIVFMQIGLMPSLSNYGKTLPHCGAAFTPRGKTAPLTADFWTLNTYRSVQYVQTAAQRQALEAFHARRREAAGRAGDQPAPVSSVGDDPSLRTTR